ncbi:hypothetical protein, partial [Mycobacteroides abscessus]|uniref:hypothetical protein n=1 Tax=Mycobacteroides abscessus TaxID=36809 RepID=UPI0010574511
MTSASNTSPVLDADRIDATAERIATDWGHHGHSTITAIITELYAELAVLTREVRYAAGGWLSCECGVAAVV